MSDPMIEIEDDIFTGQIIGIYGSTGVYSGSMAFVEEDSGIFLGYITGVYSGGIASAGNCTEIQENPDDVRGSIVHENHGYQTLEGILNEIYQGATYPKAGDTMRLIDYLEDPKPEADFYAIPDGGIAPLLVRFNDISTNNPIAYKWNFGDGSNSTQKNPIHTYATPGRYTVTLRVYTYTQTDIALKHNYILAGVLNFYADQTSGPVKLKCRFTPEIVVP